MKIQDVLADDREKGCKMTVEVSNVNYKACPTSVWVTAIVRRKQKPSATGEYQEFAKDVKRGFKLNFWSSVGHFPNKNDPEVEKHLASLAEKLLKRSCNIYVVSHKAPNLNKYSRSQEGTSFKEIYDIEGHFEFRLVEDEGYESDDE